MTKLVSSWSLVSRSFKDLKQHLGTLAKVAAIVAVPASLIQLFLSGGDSTVSTYLSLASLLMSLALLWTIIRLQQQPTVTLKAAYYQGTTNFVRFLLVSLILILQLIPLAVGLIVYSVGVVGAAPGTSLFEQIIITVLAIALALPSLFWINRSILALVAVPDRDLDPVAAVRQSWVRVKGQSWKVLGRLIVLIIVAGLIAAIPGFGLTYLSGRFSNRGFLVLFQLFVSLIVVPLIDLYLFHLYRELE